MKVREFMSKWYLAVLKYLARRVCASIERRSKNPFEYLAFWQGLGPNWSEDLSIEFQDDIEVDSLRRTAALLESRPYQVLPVAMSSEHEDLLRTQERVVVAKVHEVRD
jgi:hypothetical protein